MYLLIGLGNPGEEYAMTRHNAGFMLADFIAEKNGLHWQFDKYFKAEITKMSVGSEEILLAKPQTFMNKSGDSLKQMVIRYSLTPDHVYVAHDDLDIKLGEYKISLGKGPKLHNGIRSIEESWKTEGFWRIRIGIDNREHRIDGEEYVLSPFAKLELDLLRNTFTTSLEHIGFPFRDMI